MLQRYAYSQSRPDSSRKAPLPLLLEKRLSFPSSKLNKPRHEDVWGSGSTVSPFLASTVDEGEWLASHTCRFTPGETVPGINCIRLWVGPRAGLGRHPIPLLRIEPPFLGRLAGCLVAIPVPNFRKKGVIRGTVVPTLN
jgi:hypothetical protein